MVGAEQREHSIQIPQPPRPPPLPPHTFPRKPTSATPQEPLWRFRRGVHQILVTVHADFVSFQNVCYSEPRPESQRKSAFGPDVHQLCITVDVQHVIASDKSILGPRRMWAAKPGVYQLLVTLDGEHFIQYQNVYDNQQIFGQGQSSARGRDVHQLLLTVDGKDFFDHRYVYDNEPISWSTTQPVPELPPQPKPKPPLPQLKEQDYRKKMGKKDEKKDGKKEDKKDDMAPLYYGMGGWPPPPRPPAPRPPAPPPLPWKRTGLRRPSTFYLWEEQREKYVSICVPLCNAALKGNWRAAEAIIKDHPEVINMSITKRQDTLLHIVASTKHIHFAQNLVNIMEVKDLELQNRDEETALCVAVASTVEMVDVLLNRNNRLLKIRKNSDLPFMCAVFSGDKGMVRHIYSKTNLADEAWSYSDKRRILESCISFGLHDIAVEIYKTYKKKRIPTIDTHALWSLASNPSAFDGTVRPFIRRLVNTILPGSRKGPLDNSKAVEIVRIMLGEIVKKEKILKEISGSARKNIEGIQFTAARLGNHKFIMEILRSCPDLIWESNPNKHTIFHIAVEHRQENVYNLLHELGSKKLGTTDHDGNNIVHLAAKLPAQDRLNIVSGAALQMQRELMWFKEVEIRVNLMDRIKRNFRDQTPRELFTEQHAKLMAFGESWMKHTASQCMIVAALIATIMFAAAFTLPGGNNDNSGHPVLMNKSAFVVFVVTDAISLCTSSASILVFLAILTARYTEDDFLVSLPVKLMVGLVTLFISIANMMIAFSASFFLLYAESMKWIPVLVSVLAGLPVILFAALQYHLLFDVIRTTLNSRHLFRPGKRMLYIY